MIYQEQSDTVLLVFVLPGSARSSFRTHQQSLYASASLSWLPNWSRVDSPLFRQRFGLSAGSDAHIAAVERGVDLSMIGGTINGLSQVIMTTKQFQTLNDLRGKIIGATSATSGLGFALRRYMKAKGLNLAATIRSSPPAAPGRPWRRWRRGRCRRRRWGCR